MADEGSHGAGFDIKVKVGEGGVTLVVGEAKISSVDFSTELAGVRGRIFFDEGFEWKEGELVDFFGTSGTDVDGLCRVEKGADGSPKHGLVTIKCEEFSEGDAALDGEDSAEDEKDVRSNTAEENEEEADGMEARPVVDAGEAEGLGAFAKSGQEERLACEDADNGQGGEGFRNGGIEIGEAFGFLEVEFPEALIEVDAECGGDGHGDEHDEGETSIDEEHEAEDDEDGKKAGEQVAEDCEDGAVHLVDVVSDTGSDACWFDAFEGFLAGAHKPCGCFDAQVVEDVASDLEDVVALPAAKEAGDQFENHAEQNDERDHEQFG